MPRAMAPFAGLMLTDWGGVAAWKRAFLDAAATRGLHQYYTVHDYEDPVTISPARRIEIHAAAEAAVPPVPHDLPSAAFGDAVLVRAHAIVAHVTAAMTAEAAAVRAHNVAAAVSFLLSALSPHLRDELDESKSPSLLWAEVHAKGFVLMDDCRFFGLLENVCFANDDELPDGLTRVEEHIQRFVDVIFVPSHGSDARLLAAADRLKMALLCNACPPLMANVCEAWRADEPVWNYASMRRRLVEQCELQHLGFVANASPAPAVDALHAQAVAVPPATMAKSLEAVAVNPSSATSAAGIPCSLTSEVIGRDADDSEDDMELSTGDDDDVPIATQHRGRGRPKKRRPESSVHGLHNSTSNQQKRKRLAHESAAKAPRCGTAFELKDKTVPKRMSARLHAGTLRAMGAAPVECDVHGSSTESESDDGTSVRDAAKTCRYKPEEVEFLRSALANTTDSDQIIYVRGRAQGLFANRLLSSVQKKLLRMKTVTSAATLSA